MKRNPAEISAPLLTLASASPRRQELIRILGLPHQVVPSLLDEEAVDPAHVEPGPYVRALAMLKAEEVSEGVRTGFVLGADTVVVLDGVILGKPKDLADACRMLNALKGRTHQVLTGVALLQCEDGVVVARSVDEVADAAELLDGDGVNADHVVASSGSTAARRARSLKDGSSINVFLSRATNSAGCPRAVRSARNFSKTCFGTSGDVASAGASSMS